jgi:hypothetical protein
VIVQLLLKVPIYLDSNPIAGQNTNKLVIEELSDDNKGNYKCYAENNKEHKIINFHVTSHLSPEQLSFADDDGSIIKKTVRSNQFATLKCNVQGSPAPGVQWFTVSWFNSFLTNHVLHFSLFLTERFRN